ncbi:MAG: virulence RhuM family protein [Bdellovibrionaceae bacterium]|nr:virulence RhuM family protein [Pseudobdellovibrionaceae bacterium]MBX3034328.1 virulence RhuM family protein [Pseudobdellovibrionaceae bacterium]
MQNKLHWAVHGLTAAELVVRRADASKKNMGLTSWKNSSRSIALSPCTSTMPRIKPPKEIRCPWLIG